MKSKISSLSKNEDFKSILNGKKISNKYLTIFFKKLADKKKNKLNISFVTKKKNWKCGTKKQNKKKIKKYNE